jgi:hypothetical protein
MPVRHGQCFVWTCTKRQPNNRSLHGSLVKAFRHTDSVNLRDSPHLKEFAFFYFFLSFFRDSVWVKRFKKKIELRCYS